MAGIKTLEAQLADGTARTAGDVAILGQLAVLMVDFDPLFEIMPGSKGRTEIAKTEAYKASVGAVIPE